jgi:hypothetical protein
LQSLWHFSISAFQLFSLSIIRARLGIVRLRATTIAILRPGRILQVGRLEFVEPARDFPHRAAQHLGRLLFECGFLQSAYDVVQHQWFNGHGISGLERFPIEVVFHSGFCV